MQDSSLYSRLLALTETVELPTGAFVSEIGAVKTRLAAALSALGVGGGAPTAPVTITSAVGSSALTIAGGTQVASFPALNVTQTWNNAVVVFTAAKVNVTDTASAAASLFLDLQIGGVSKFTINKAGTALSSVASVTVPAFASIAQPTSGLSFRGNSPGFLINAVHIIEITSTSIRVGSTVGIAWTPTSNPAAVHDLQIDRDAAGILAQKNLTNAQTFRIYGTFTDVSNYERTAISHVTGTGTLIAAQTLGTGADNQNIVLTPAGSGAVNVTGSVSFSSGANLFSTNNYILSNKALSFRNASDVDGVWMRGDSGVVLSDVTRLMFSTTGSASSGATDTRLSRAGAGIFAFEGASLGAALELWEMVAPAAPATNKARVYLQDNGSGKTQYMIQFATGVAQQLAIEA